VSFKLFALGTPLRSGRVTHTEEKFTENIQYGAHQNLHYYVLNLMAVHLKVAVYLLTWENLCNGQIIRFKINFQLIGEVLRYHKKVFNF